MRRGVLVTDKAASGIAMITVDPKGILDCYYMNFLPDALLQAVMLCEELSSIKSIN